MPEIDGALLREMGLGAGLPALMAAVIALLASRLWRSGLKRLYLPANLAFAGSFFSGYAFLSFAVWWPNEPDFEWLPYLALIAGLVAAGARLTNLPYLRWAGAIIVPIIVGALIVPVWPKLQPVIWLWRIAVALAVALMWIGLQLPSEQIGGPRLTGMLAAIHFAAGGMLFMAGFAKFAQLAFLGGAVLVGVLVAECIDGNTPLVPGLAPAFAVLHTGLLACGWLRSDADAPKANFVLVWLAPIALATAWLPRLRRRRWAGLLIPTATAIALVMAALAIVSRGRS